MHHINSLLSRIYSLEILTNQPIGLLNLPQGAVGGRCRTALQAFSDRFVRPLNVFLVAVGIDENRPEILFGQDFLHQGQFFTGVTSVVLHRSIRGQFLDSSGGVLLLREGPDVREPFATSSSILSLLRRGRQIDTRLTQLRKPHSDVEEALRRGHRLLIEEFNRHDVLRGHRRFEEALFVRLVFFVRSHVDHDLFLARTIITRTSAFEIFDKASKLRGDD